MRSNVKSLYQISRENSIRIISISPIIAKPATWTLSTTVSDHMPMCEGKIGYQDLKSPERESNHFQLEWKASLSLESDKVSLKESLQELAPSDNLLPLLNKSRWLS